MGVASQRFVDMHKDKVAEMKRLLVVYVRSLIDMRSRTTTSIQTPVVPNIPKIQMSPDGYPILPTETNFAEWKKNHLTEAIRTYLNAHYSKTITSQKRKPVYSYTMIELASGSKRSVPFKAIQRDNNRFIEKKYLPPDVTMKEVKNMQKDDVIKFMEHALKRQETYGYQDAFRFAIYIKKQKEHPSLYRGDRPPTRSTKSTNSKRKKKKIQPTRSQDLNVIDNGDENGIMDHGTPASRRPVRMAIPKGKGKEVNPGDVSDISKSHHSDLIDSRSDAFINEPHAGIHSTLGPADASCNEASSSKNRFPSGKLGDTAPNDCPSDVFSSELAAGMELTAGTADTPCNDVSSLMNNLPTQTRKSKKPFVLLNKQGSQKKKSQVGRSDALAIEEAKNLLRTSRKRCR
jgi:hypothetical protein